MLEGTHKYFHGEKVIFGTIALENAPTEEINQVLDFCLEIGVDSITEEETIAVVEKSCIPEKSIYAMPFPIDIESVAAAIITADKIEKTKNNRGM